MSRWSRPSASDLGVGMEIVFADGETERELVVSAGRPDATVTDLAAALRVTGPDLTVDGRIVAGDLALGESGLVTGSVVVPVGGAATPGGKAATSALILRVVGGLQAGWSAPLRVGRNVLGRGENADIRFNVPDVSREHCLIEVSASGAVTVADLESRNGTDVDGTRVGRQRVPIGADNLVGLGGAVIVQVLPLSRLGAGQHVDPRREARLNGRLPFNRVPRTAAVPAAPPLRMPVAPARAHRMPFSVAALLGPLALAGVMIAVTHDAAFALIAGLSPLLFLADFVEERTRGRRSLRRGARAFHAELEAFAAELRARRDAEVRARRSKYPDPAETAHRAVTPGLRLWERRPGAADFLRVAVGLADLPWDPPVDGPDVPDERLRDLLADFAVLRQVPVPVDVSAGGVLGLTGDREAALAVARSVLCQAAVGSGPADVMVAVFADAERSARWDWVKWLPHVLDPRGGPARLIAVGPEQSDALARSLATGAAGSSRDAGPVLFVVVDGASLLEGRPCPLRDLLAGRHARTAGVVLTDRLPALCTATLQVRADGMALLQSHTTVFEVPDLLACGIDEERARGIARRLARFEDPELRVEGAGLPDQIALLPLLGLPTVAGLAVADRWQAGGARQRVGAVLGVTEQGVFAVDLDDDGPHGLIAGTTGSGKSELLRTLIISMAVGNDPEHLTFALVDYKGGGALDECAGLPHAVGLVTDLDEQLGERALRCLEAEVRHREHLFRDAGLSHIRDYQRLRDDGRRDLEPMPRLVVVIDEFATLAKALPSFVDSLVSVAQRGRSLGMHLIMATQRPAGSVGDAIKNNVKLRIALRLESASDSDDVIDDPAAAAIGSRQWGRGYYRLGGRQVLPVQTALSTGVTLDVVAAAAVAVAPFTVAPAPAVPGGASSGQAGPTDLQRLVTAAREAFELRGFAPPRRPWPDPLPDVVKLEDLPDAGARGLLGEPGGAPAFAFADDPEQQSQYPVGCDPQAGNILIYGSVGAGTSGTLLALALAAAASADPGRLYIFVLDFGAGELAPLQQLPHTGAYIGAAERERQARLIRLLRLELDRRKVAGAARSAPDPDWLALVDNIGALVADFDKDVAGMNLIEDLQRVYADGPAVGIRFAVTADRSGAVPGTWGAATRQKLLLRLADSTEYGYFDVPRSAVPAAKPGRALVAATRQVVQVGWPGADLPAAVARAAARHPGARRHAPTVGLLPDRVGVRELGAAARVGSDPWWIPVGIGDRTLRPVGLELYEHEHALIAGPPRSGRSAALLAIAEAVRAAADPPAIFGLTTRRSSLRTAAVLDGVVTAYSELERLIGSAVDRALLLLVDDAEAVEDSRGVLERLMTDNARAHIVAAGRADTLRRGYGHWTQKVRESRTGVLLIPDHDMDGDLLGATLPRLGRMAPATGRGYLVVAGMVDGLQAAAPDDA